MNKLNSILVLLGTLFINMHGAPTVDNFTVSYDKNSSSAKVGALLNIEDVLASAYNNGSLKISTDWKISLEVSTRFTNMFPHDSRMEQTDKIVA